MPALSQDEFDRWVEDDRAYKQRMLDHIDAQNVLNLNTHGRIATLEAKQDDCSKQAATRSSWISALVSAIVSGVASAVFGGGK